MALIYIDDLTEGMILAEDLFTPAGRFVLAAGASLQSDHLKILKSWGIIEADIAEASLGEEYSQNLELNAEVIERAESYLWRRFILNDLDQEPLVSLYRRVVHRFALSLQQGWDPVAFSDVALPASDQDCPPPLSVPHLLKGDVDIVSLPTVYTHIVELLDHPNTSSHQIAKVISKDASLTVRLLRLVNSPVYGFSGKIDSISRAVSLLGTDELTTLTLGITVVKQFQNIPSELLNMDSFWRHSIRCGLFSKVLAGYLGEKAVEKYFIGGLLHDIGRLIMLDRMAPQYSGAIAKARLDHLPMYRAEQDRLKTDHSIIGKLLAEKWRLSPALIRMIGSHHSPRLAHYSREACIVHIADILAHACGHEVLLVNEIPELQIKAWEETGLSEELIAPTIQQVDAEFKEIVRVFFGGLDPVDDAD
ncbi:MAG: HDOD domain-containing protein [Thermodesulfobacteriota bacterium]|nr:HDOD domain-containing protein [Thermodesulfobacteriota bacterium]